MQPYSFLCAVVASAILFEGFSILLDSSVSGVESLSPVLPFDCESRCFLVNNRKTIY